MRTVRLRGNRIMSLKRTVFRLLLMGSVVAVGCGESLTPGEAGGTDGAGGTEPAPSICGSERPCVPEGIWIVSYEAPDSAPAFGSNTIHIGADGADVLGESVPDDTCTPGASTPGDLRTTAELSNDGCTLTAKISKYWCDYGEGQCESRNITLDFCSNGSATVAAGSLEVCRCWGDGSTPGCVADENLDASATRMWP